MRRIRSQQNGFIIYDVDDLLDINLIIHMKSLISLLQQNLCSECNHLYNGSSYTKTRN